MSTTSSPAESSPAESSPAESSPAESSVTALGGVACSDTSAQGGSGPQGVPCPVLASLTAAVAAVAGLAVPDGLGAADVLGRQVDALAGAVGALQRQLAVRMAALEREGPPISDVRGRATRAGVDERRSRLLRTLGLFAAQHPPLQAAWLAGAISQDQVQIVRGGARRLSLPLARTMIDAVLPRLPELDTRATRTLIDHVVDQLAPAEPDLDEKHDHDARRLVWSRTPRGGIVLDGYLPAPQAEAFTAAVTALTESLRVDGDDLSTSQRRADALTALVERATAHGLPTGGGLPPAMTLTVSLTEAQRIAARDPNTFARHPIPRPRSRSRVGDHPAGDATVRFALCCAAITPILDAHTQPPAPTTHGESAVAHPASLIGRIADTPAQPIAVGRAVRLATPAQRQALRLRDQGCAIPGCDIDAGYTQPHHITGWALGGPTDLDNLVSLCTVHHTLTELGHFHFQPRHPNQPTPPGALTHPTWWIIPRSIPRR